MAVTDKMIQEWAKQKVVIQSAVKDGCLKLNSWETEFFEDIASRQVLTWNQSKALRRIYGKVG